MRLFSSSLISFLINIGFLSILVAMARKEEIKPYKVYKIDIVKIEEKKIPEKKKVIPKKRLIFPKKEISSLPKEVKSLAIAPKEENNIPMIEGTPSETLEFQKPETQEPTFQEQEIFDVKSLDEPLKIISFTMPNYPSFAKENGIEGIVKIKLLINPEGFVKDIEVITEEPKGVGFKEEVLKVAWNYKFNQPKVLKKPVFVYCILPLRFSLED